MDETDRKRLIRVEAKLTRMALYLGIPIDKEGVIPDPQIARIGYDPEQDKPYLEIGNFDARVFDLERLFQQLEMAEPVDIRMRGMKIGTFHGVMA